MTDVSAAAAIMPLAAGGILGFATGWFMKKIIKLALKVAMIGAAIFTLLIVFMQSRNYITGVNWDKISSDASASIVSLANQTAANSQSITGMFDGLGILFPVGFLPGIVIGFSKG